MAKLIITRGLPASGKSTRAKAWVAEDPTRRARVNRDTLRLMMHDGAFIQGSSQGPDTEEQIKVVRDAAIKALLARGVDVVCDDTNLPQRVARDLRRLAVLAGGEFEVWDLTDVRRKECLRRNALREGAARVPDEVIQDMYRRYIQDKGYPLPVPEEAADGPEDLVPYEPKPGTPKAIVVDIDGTVALRGLRSPFDETRVGEDLPNEPVIEAVRLHLDAGYRVVFVSGRSYDCRSATRYWLNSMLGNADFELFMRPADDNRKDSVVKRELFDTYVRDQYNVRAVYDDREQVVAMWRSLGLTVMQVAEGKF